jgi:MFS family permease
MWTEVRGYCLAVFLVCLLGWILTNMDQSLFAYAVPGIAAEFNASNSDIGLLFSISFAFTALVVVIVGIFTDYYGRRIMFLVSLAISALFVGLHYFASGLVMLTILRMFAYGFSNALAPITNAYVAEAAPPRYRGLMVGLLQTGFAFGWFFAFLIAFPILENFGWRFVFLPALLVIPVAFFLVTRLPESKRFEEQKKKEMETGESNNFLEKIAELFGPELRRRTILCFIAFVMWGGSYAGTAFFMPNFFVEVRGYTGETAAALVGSSYLVAIFGYIAAAFLGEFYTTRRNIIVIWSWLGALGLIGLLWASPNFVTDAIWFSLMGAFFFGAAAVIMTFVVEIFPTRVRATGAGFAGTFAFSLGSAIYPLMVSSAAESIGWQLAFTWATVPSLLICGIAILNIENFKSGIDLDEISI